MKTKQTTILIGTLITLSLVALGNGCSGFLSSQIEHDGIKQSVISEPIFEEKPAEADPWPTLPAAIEETTPDPVYKPVQYLCSNNATNKLNSGVNLLTAESIKFVISDGVGVACTLPDTEDKRFLNQLRNRQALDVAGLYWACANSGNLQPESYSGQQEVLQYKAMGQPLEDNVVYRVKLFGLKNGLEKNLNWIGDGDSAGGQEDFYIKKTGSTFKMGVGPTMYRPAMVLANVNVGNEEICDARNSPLIIQLYTFGRYREPIELTSQSSGIMFDLLGENAKPAPHTKVRISWLSPTSGREYYFLVKPNANNQVAGIDELFGDNTKGPDEKFAANGYEALAKYDSNRDGKIDASDPVFTQLRLWKDENFNGTSEPYELYTLNEKQLVYIDLNYDGSYLERDAYGNETRMKSVVMTRDNRLHLIFDLWFRWL